MSNKRPYQSAFLYGTPVGMLDTANGFDAPHPLVQQHTSLYTSHALRIPGQWPSDATLIVDEESAPPRSTFFTAMGKWAATVANVTNLFALSARVAQSFLRRQTIKAVPIIRSDGSNKKRFIAAGVADEPATPSPSVRARADRSGHQLLTRTASLSPDASPSPPSRDTTPAPFQFTSPQSFEQHSITSDSFDDSYNEQDEDASLDYSDDSLDYSFEISFENCLSSTPPRNPGAGSPTPLAWNSPQNLSPVAQSPLRAPQPVPAASPSWSSPQLPSPCNQTLPDSASPCPKESVALPPGLQRHYRKALNLPSVTPVRHQLLKLQFRAETARHIALEGIELRRTAMGSDSADPALAPPSPTEVVDQDLSNLSDAPSSPFEPVHNIEDLPQFVYENDMSFLSDALSLPINKGVRWARHAGAKRFFFDAKVSEMLDSTIESIHSNAELSWLQSENGDEAAQSLSPPRLTVAADSNEAAYESSDDGGFHGIPADTFDASDDTLEECEFSQELIGKIGEDMLHKLSLEPPPLPPPKPLITPLSSEELDALESAAAQTSNGLKAENHVVGGKLKAKDFATLLPRLFNGDPKAWLNDEIVNDYLSILVAHKKKEAGFAHQRGGPAPPVHAFSSFWYNAGDTSRWASRVHLNGKQFLDAKLVLYPICDGGHWRLMAVKPQERSIEYLDSLDRNGAKYIEKMQTYLKKELGAAYIEEEWSTVSIQRSTQQLNGSDCGVFTLLNALALLRGEDANRVVACNGMADARERIATTLMARRPTTEME